MRKTGKVSIILLLMLSILLVKLPSLVYATSSTQEKLNKAKQEKQETENKLNETEGNISNLEDTKTGLQGKLSGLNSDLTDVSANLTQLEEDIVNKEAQIEQTQAELAEAKKIEEDQYYAMKQRIKYMYERGDMAYLETLLSAGSFADFLNVNQYFLSVAEYDREMLDLYKETKEKIAKQEEALKVEKEDLDTLKVEVEEEKKRVSGLVKDTSNSIAGYANEIESAEEAALAYEQQMKAQAEDIAALQKQLEEEIRLSQLASRSAVRDISEIVFEDGDLDLLAALIECEAGGESYEGKVAVGAVVINRVKSSVYPNSMAGVIYANKQFSPVASGRVATVLARGANSSCYQAAQEAMSGVTNVGDCVYFRTPIPGLTGIQIGGHIFY